MGASPTFSPGNRNWFITQWRTLLLLCSQCDLKHKPVPDACPLLFPIRHLPFPLPLGATLSQFPLLWPGLSCWGYLVPPRPALCHILSRGYTPPRPLRLLLLSRYLMIILVNFWSISFQSGFCLIFFLTCFAHSPGLRPSKTI